MDKLKWIYDQNTKLFIHKAASETIVSEMAATLCLNTTSASPVYI